MVDVVEPVKMNGRKAAPATRFRRLLRCSLATFLIGITLFCVYLGVIAHQMRRQREFVAEWENRGGTVIFGDGIGIVAAISNQFGVLPIRTVVGLQIYQGTHIDQALSGVSELHGLESVWIRDADLSDEGLSRIAQCENLISLTISRTEVTDIGLAHIAKIRSLQNLTLHDNAMMTFGDKEASEIRKLGRLQALMLPDNAWNVRQAIELWRPGVLVKSTRVGLPTYKPQE